jgi:sugar lactone lactonase YvrE
MSHDNPLVAFGAVHELSEGPRWDPLTGTVSWVDIVAGRVWRGVVDTDGITVTERLDFPDTVGAAVPSSDGGLLVAAHDRLVAVSPRGQRHSTGALIDLARHGRFNDAAVDPAGRLVVGTKGAGPGQGAAALFRLEPDATLTTLRDGFNLANGIGWSPGGDILYAVDSLPGVLWSARYDVDAGEARGWAPLVTTFGGLPDGLTVDAQGRIWVAVWNAAQVACFAPSGELLRTMAVAAPHVTAVCFVGPRLDRLLITTARDELDEPRRRLFPDSGRLFLADVGAVGLPPRSWSGSTDGSGWHPDAPPASRHTDPHPLETS